MATANTIKVQDGDSFKVINSEDFQEGVHKPVVGKGEIIVKPKGVEDAKPFLIDEKDFDSASYERVNATNANVAEVAKQTDRQTLHEIVGDGGESRSILGARNSAETNQSTAKSGESSTGKVGDIQTPQTQLKRNQANKK